MVVLAREVQRPDQVCVREMDHAPGHAERSQQRLRDDPAHEVREGPADIADDDTGRRGPVPGELEESALEVVQGIGLSLGTWLYAGWQTDRELSQKRQARIALLDAQVAARLRSVEHFMGDPKSPGLGAMHLMVVVQQLSAFNIPMQRESRGQQSEGGQFERGAP